MKEDKITALIEKDKRYYPTLANGQIDEWHALIKLQADQIKKEDKNK